MLAFLSPKQKKAMGLSVFGIEVSFFAGGLSSGLSNREIWALFFGALGWALAEIAAWLGGDYYSHRRHRFVHPHTPFLSDQLNPAQGVLKLSWGLYLLAFLFPLLSALLLMEKGWVLMPLAFFGFFLGYYGWAEPFEWDRRLFGLGLSSMGRSFLPFLSGLCFAPENVYRLPWMIPVFVVFFLMRQKQMLQAPTFYRHTSFQLPAYRFIPGETERHQEPLEKLIPLKAFEAVKANHWKKCPGFLYGVDLFNRGYYWEAHEAWEQVWKNYAPQSDEAQFLQSLIQTAAGLIKYHVGNAEGVRRLSEVSLEKMQGLQSKGPLFFGVKLKPWIEEVQKTFAPVQFLKENDPFPKPRHLVLHLVE